MLISGVASLDHRERLCDLSQLSLAKPTRSPVVTLSTKPVCDTSDEISFIQLSSCRAQKYRWLEIENMKRQIAKASVRSLLE